MCVMEKLMLESRLKMQDVEFPILILTLTLEEVLHHLAIADCPEQDGHEEEVDLSGMKLKAKLYA